MLQIKILSRHIWRLYSGKPHLYNTSMQQHPSYNLIAIMSAAILLTPLLFEWPDRPQMPLLCDCVNCFNYSLQHNRHTYTPHTHTHTHCLWLALAHPYDWALMDLLAIFNLAALSLCLSFTLSAWTHARRHLKCVSDSPAITARCIRLLFMRRSAIHRHLHSLPQCHAVIESLHILTSTHSLSDDISG